MTSTGCQLGRLSLLIFGNQRRNVLARLNGQAFNLSLAHVLNVLAFKVNLEMLGNESQIVVVIIKRRVKVIPGVVQTLTSGIVHQVVIYKRVVTDVLHFKDKVVMLGNVEGAIERLGYWIFIGRRWFPVGIRWQNTGHFHHPGFELFVAITLRIT